MRTDGRTDMTTLKVVFRNFANAPKIVRVRANVPSTQKVSCNCFNMRLGYINTDIMAGSTKGTRLKWNTQW